MTHFFRFCFWAALAFALVMALLPEPPPLPGSVSDKLQHMMAFFTLAVLGSLAYPRVNPLVLALALFAFGGLIEVAQMIPILHRSSDMVDWAADMIAATAGLAAVTLARGLFGNRTPTA